MPAHPAVARKAFFGRARRPEFFVAPYTAARIQAGTAPGGQHLVVQRFPLEGRGDPFGIGRGTDAIHQPIIDRYRRETGLTPDQGPSDAEIKYVLAPAYFGPVATLNRERHSSVAYETAIVNWLDDRQIWPVLESRRAREEFVRYVVGFDLTDCRPYQQGEQRTAGACRNFQRNAESFANLCQGYASQFFARYTARGRLPEADRDRLARFGRVYVERIPPKFHMPIFMGTVPGHAFNAILVGEDPRALRDYLFLEPQNDDLFASNSATFRSYVSQGILTIGRLAAFNEREQYVEETEQTFVQEASGAFVNQPLTGSQRIALSRLLSAFAIAEDADAWRVTIRERGTTFEDHLRREGQISSDANLIFAARFLIGRNFRRSPQSLPETITADVYLDMLGRRDLAPRLGEAQGARAP